MLTQRAKEVRIGERLIVGADQDPSDGPLDVDRLCNREESRQLVQTLAIGQFMARERVERPCLSVRIAHACDSMGDTAQFVHVCNRPVPQVDLCDLYVIVVRAQTER